VGVDEGLGATLRETRNRRKIDLTEVEAATKIRVRYLRAMENEEWDLLPGDAYARGFVRTYAGYLGLDADRLAEQLRRRGKGSAPAERLPRIESRPAGRPRQRRQLPGLPPRMLAVLVSLALVGVLLVIGLTSGGSEGGGSGGTAGQKGRGKGSHPGTKAKAPSQAQNAAAGQSLRLTATAEVWVCLLGKDGKRLVDGQILEQGEEAGPFRSGSFTVAMGNGSVQISLDGRRARIPPSSSPVGYRIDRHGHLSEVPEGERPTCT